MKDKAQKVFMGVDVGGTKIMAALVKASGDIIARKRCPSPRGGAPEAVVLAILEVMDGLLSEAGYKRKSLRAVGIGIPGVVDAEEGKIVVTPNMNLSGVDLAPHVSERFKAPVVLGNDVNLGTLGEKWLGNGRFVQNVVGVFVGTGIGGGIVINGKLVTGARDSAGEMGHIVMQINGPLCGCGNRGCLEALASRSAIERDIREAVKAGQKTVLTRTVGKDLKVIRSRMLKQALQEGDRLVTEVVRRASEALGYGCLTVRHLLDPDLIILGGGVIEACGDYMLPVVEQIVAADALPGARPGGWVTRSALGDDAVALGAVALAQEAVGRSPISDASQQLPKYPTIAQTSFGRVVVDDKTYKRDIYIRADGEIRSRKKEEVKEKYGTSHEIGPEELEKVTKGADVLVIGTGQKGMAGLTAEGEAFLRRMGVTFLTLPTPMALREYNHMRGRKAALLHVTC